MMKSLKRENDKAMASTKSRSKRRLIKDLGWTRERAMKVRACLGSFDQDWNAPGMGSYDEPEER